METRGWGNGENARILCGTMSICYLQPTLIPTTGTTTITTAPDQDRDGKVNSVEEAAVKREEEEEK